ncbi:MAG: DUF4157 domain-containing protein [Thermomicrobiales bacterium]
MAGSMKYPERNAPNPIKPRAGRPIEAGVREEMEHSLGHSFEDVRVHTGPDASAAASSMNARAFSVGRQIVFDQDQYRPWSTDGRELLAHELAHTAQRPASGAELSTPGDAGDGKHRRPVVQRLTGRRRRSGTRPAPRSRVRNIRARRAENSPCRQWT